MTLWRNPHRIRFWAEFQSNGLAFGDHRSEVVDFTDYQHLQLGWTAQWGCIIDTWDPLLTIVAFLVAISHLNGEDLIHGHDNSLEFC